MDKNQSIGFLLMAALLLIYFWFFAPKPKPQTETSPNVVESREATDQPAIQSDEPTIAEISETPPDTATRRAINDQYGIFASAGSGEEKDYILENDKINITFSSKGGSLKKVILKEYDDYQFNPLVLLDDESNKIDYLIQTTKGQINLADLYYNVKKRNLGDTSIIEFKADFGDNIYISQTYRIEPGNYNVKYKMTMEGLGNLVLDGKVDLIWKDHLKRTETDITYSRYYTTINYYTTDGTFDDLKSRSSDKQEYTFEMPVTWISFKQKFFTSALIFNEPVSKGYISTEVNEADTNTVKTAFAKLELPLSHFSEGSGSFTYFFGPNRLNVLKRMPDGFTENLYLGWPVIKWINRYAIIPIFTFLEKYFASYGLIIIILVFIIKMILSPLTYKSHISMAKTRVLKPELDALKEKIGGDAQAMQAEQMKLYKQVGVNPLSGCIPMLLQMPILFAMFQFIPNAIELRLEPFLWASDLSTYDSILTLPFSLPGYGSHVSLFTLLMTLSTILYTWINSQATATMQGPMKTMQYFMPVIFMFVLNSYPAGLTFYYFVSNIVSFAQIAIIRKFVDDDKIKKVLEENKLKNANKKKSPFQLRLDKAMKASDTSKKKKKSKK